MSILEPTLQVNENMANLAMIRTQSDPISTASRVGSALILLAGGRVLESMRTHGVAESSVYQNFYKFLDAVNNTPELEIKFDLHEDTLVNTASGFNKLSTYNLFSHCVGAIDGLAIKITCPKGVMNQSGYYSGNKKSYTLNMQAVCDSNCLFTSVSVKHIGSTNDVLHTRILHLQI